MPKRRTLESFIKDSQNIHGDKYRYSEVKYINVGTKVKIFCKHCSEYFMQTPREHLDGCGCPKCGRNKIKSKLYGVGINDLNEPISCKGKQFRFYLVWRSMFYRCYYEKFHERERSYSDCEVCEEWHKLSNFKKWFDENYIEGYELDKDILVGGKGKLYSPNTCCFVPQEINKLFTSHKYVKSKYGRGVCKSTNGYWSCINIKGESKYIGLFKTPNEAHSAYVKERMKYIISVAGEYYSKRLITDEVYNAICKYKEYG